MFPQKKGSKFEAFWTGERHLGHFRIHAADDGLKTWRFVGDLWM